jgi:flap endonuclease-1
MGIKYLNKYLRSNCTESIKRIHFGELQWKKIVVDISIYLYKFKGEGALMEQMYLMINIFRYYNIVPIFVFDGKPPEEKREVINQRKEKRKEAQINYDLLKEQFENSTSEEEKNLLISQMDNEKKRSVKITQTDIQQVKELITSLGTTYYEASGEADQVCAYLMNKKIVYGCLSEDMDMFVYGCNRVFRYLSLFHRTCEYYNLQSILKTLDLSFNEFKEICVLSGTDYNNDSDAQINVYDVMKFHIKYKKQNNISISFYEWLQKTNKLKNNTPFNEIIDMFNVNNICEGESLQKLIIKNISINKSDVESIMSNHNFIFVK